MSFINLPSKTEDVMSAFNIFEFLFSISLYLFMWCILFRFAGGSFESMGAYFSIGHCSVSSSAVVTAGPPRSHDNPYTTAMDTTRILQGHSWTDDRVQMKVYYLTIVRLTLTLHDCERKKLLVNRA